MAVLDQLFKKNEPEKHWPFTLRISFSNNQLPLLANKIDFSLKNYNSCN
jgi:hypothetical protein